MANIGFSRNERGYVQLETTFGIIPNASGTATLVGTNNFRFKKMELHPAVEDLVREDKTGSRSTSPAVPGRRSAMWTMNADLSANGTPGVLPNIDPFLQCAMGTAATINSGTATITGATNAAPIVCTATNTFSNGDVVTISGATGACASGPNGAGLNGTFVLTAVSGTGFTLLGSTGTGALTGTVTASRVNIVYRLADSPIYTMSIWSFRQPATLQQRVAMGSSVKNFKFTLNQKIADVSFAGDSRYVLDSQSVGDGSADSTELGGLTTFPTEPSNPTTSGGIIPGYQGRFVLNGTSLIRINSVEITVETGNVLPSEYFGTQYPSAPEGDERTVSFTLDVDEDDSTGIQALYEAAENKTQLEMVAQIGTVPGSIFLIHCQGVQLAVPTTDDSQRRWQLKFGTSKTHGSSLTALDDIAIWVC